VSGLTMIAGTPETRDATNGGPMRVWFCACPVGSPWTRQTGSIGTMMELSHRVPVVCEDTIGAVGVSGAPGGDKDEACAKAGIDKVASELK
jgi:Haem-degrading